MASTTKLKLTQAGERLLGKLHSNKTSKITLNSIVAGSGVWSEQELLSSNINKLKNPLLQTNSLEISTDPNSSEKITILGILNNSTLENSFLVREVGVTAIDPDDGEILYLLAVKTEDELTSVIESNIYPQNFPIHIEFLGTTRDRVTVNVTDSSILVNKDRFEKELSKINAIVLALDEKYAKLKHKHDDTDLNLLEIPVVPVGAIFPIAIAWGAERPLNTGKYKYVELTAGAPYNEGLFSLEYTALASHRKGVNYGRYIQSYGKVHLEGSIFHNKNVTFINTERRYLRAGYSYDENYISYDDTMRPIKEHIFRTWSTTRGIRRKADNTFFYDVNADHLGKGQDFLNSGVSNSYYYYAGGTDTFIDLSRVMPIAKEIAPRTYEFTYFMRIL